MAPLQDGHEGDVGVGGDGRWLEVHGRDEAGQAVRPPPQSVVVPGGREEYRGGCEPGLLVAAVSVGEVGAEDEATEEVE